MATPETFSETGSETMYEKVWLQRHTRSAMTYYYAPPEIELVEDQRGASVCARGSVVRGWKRWRARSGSLHCCAAPWTNLRITFDAPSLGPDVGQKPLLTARPKHD